MKRIKTVAIFLFLLSNVFIASAQTLPLGLLHNLEDNFRRQQLLGNDTSKRSFMVRPLHMSEADDLNYGDSASSVKLRTQLWASSSNKFKLYALPITLQQQLNSHHPYGINDGAMIPSKGYQAMFSAGVFLKAGPLTVQFRPEYVFAQNSKYPVLTDFDQPATLLNAYYGYYNSVDAPSNFGNGTYSQFNLGQSSVRLNLGAASVGISNENLWWGPGRYNSLIMTNNAAGFKHLTLNTTKPVITAIGSFEAQLIAGKLENSGVANPEGVKYSVKKRDSRYINGLSLAYQPKWISGLYLGLNRSFISYSNDVGNSFTDYLPVFSFLTKSAYAEDSNSNTEDTKKRDQLISFFTRWVWPESRSEIYFEWGREDHSWNGRDAFLEPEHTRAYVVGFNKLVPFRQKAGEFIQIGVEFSQLEQSNSNEVRGAGTWYSHSQIIHGYTQKGQFLGAGNGPDNMQTLDIAWVKELKRIGLKIERRVHNNDLYYKGFNATRDPRRHWVDLGFIGQFDYTKGKITLNAQLGLINSLNYQYYLPNPPVGEYWHGNKNDFANFNLKIGLMYSL
ncbi:capsule assembly Wzi family protein [Pedobacter insulae]|uniref:Capsule assembly protein Wzi n=1 Tax=Pedobacter insulae TaxID=414048 RepID=A0A1I2TC40_9SPHI|nr:capsule assembly Wzi family protein [Pedobacter insulae]SFG62400.1 Capsule assembly protein Wzi [Pedobacter insulae]